VCYIVYDLLIMPWVIPIDNAKMKAEISKSCLLYVYLRLYWFISVLNLLYNCLSYDYEINNFDLFIGLYCLHRDNGLRLYSAINFLQRTIDIISPYDYEYRAFEISVVLTPLDV